MQSFIPCVLQVIINKLGSEIAPFAKQIYSTLYKIFDIRQVIVDEALAAMNALFTQCNEILNLVIHNFKPILLNSILTDDTTTLVGLTAISTIFDIRKEVNFTEDNGKFVDELITNLIRRLQTIVCISFIFNCQTFFFFVFDNNFGG